MQRINEYNAQTYNPKFTSILRIKCKGLYKKAPEEAQKLVDAFKKNDFAMDFCKNKYNVKIVFDANKKTVFVAKDKRKLTSSSMKIHVYNPTTSKLKKFLQTITPSTTRVNICKSEYNASLRFTTNWLIESILPEDSPPVFSTLHEMMYYMQNLRGEKGELSGKLGRIYNDKQKRLKRKEIKSLRKQRKNQEKADAKTKLNKLKEQLKASIETLIKAN